MPHHISEEHLFIFAVIADTHVTEEEASAIGGYDVDTVKLGAARSAYVVRELNRLASSAPWLLGSFVVGQASSECEK